MTQTKTQAVPADAALQDLPRTIRRRCCWWETSCGNTELTLMAEKNLLTGTETYAYRRGNGDDYLQSSTVEGLIEQLNDTQRWPLEEEEPLDR